MSSQNVDFWPSLIYDPTQEIKRLIRQRYRKVHWKWKKYSYANIIMFNFSYYKQVIICIFLMDFILLQIWSQYKSL